MSPRFLTLLILVCSALAALAAPTQRPNVIFILADDYGWKDLGCYGSTYYETPNLNRLAAQGMRFTQAYAACNVCSPTRASILTGKYPARLHITDWLPGRGDNPRQMLSRPIITQHLPLEEFTIAKALKANGYHTGLVGKWHLGGPGFYPQDQGFDVNFGGSENGSTPSFFSPYNISKAKGRVGRMPNLLNGPEGEYLTDRLTDEALHFIEQSKDQPFFLYLAHYAVHTPHEAKKATIERFRDKAKALPPAGPEFLPEHDHMSRQIQNHPVYAAMIESMDEGVGRILDKLEQLGLDKQTIVIFTSDNGGLTTSEGSPTSNLPLRAGKGWNYEGGIREPLLVKWPGVTQAGSVCESPVISTDYYPTILEAAGLPAHPEQHVDGASFVSLLHGGTQPVRPLFWHYPHYSNQGGHPGGAIREGDFKLLESYEDMHLELYNLKDDIGEKHDLAQQMPEKAADLQKKLQTWRESVGAQMPTPNPKYNPNLPPLENETKKSAGVLKPADYEWAVTRGVDD